MASNPGDRGPASKTYLPTPTSPRLEEESRPRPTSEFEKEESEPLGGTQEFGIDSPMNRDEYPSVVIGEHPVAANHEQEQDEPKTVSQIRDAEFPQLNEDTNTGNKTSERSCVIGVSHRGPRALRADRRAQREHAEDGQQGADRLGASGVSRGHRGPCGYSGKRIWGTTTTEGSEPESDEGVGHPMSGPPRRKFLHLLWPERRGPVLMEVDPGGPT